MSATHRGAVETTCRVCGAVFIYDGDHYARHALVQPATCRPCREARAARLVEVVVQVDRVDPRFIFAKADEGTFFIAPALVHSSLGPLAVRDERVVAFDPAEPVLPGRRPRALRVRRP